MRHSRTRRIIILSTTCDIALVLCGCSDPRFKQEQQRRDARMTHHLQYYADHDAGGVNRIRQIVRYDKRVDQQRADHLTYTCGLFRLQHERDVQRWNEEEPLRKARLEAYFYGKPDEIDDTYARMVY